MGESPTLCHTKLPRPRSRRGRDDRAVRDTVWQTAINGARRSGATLAAWMAAHGYTRSQYLRAVWTRSRQRQWQRLPADEKAKYYKRAPRPPDGGNFTA